MLSRTSHVKRTIVRNVSSSSNFQIGDAHYIDSTADIIGALVNSNIFIISQLTDEVDKDTNYSYKAPCPSIDENIKMTRFNVIPKICVNNIDIIAVSAAGIFQIGNTDHIRMASSIYFKILNNQPIDKLPISKGE